MSFKEFASMLFIYFGGSAEPFAFARILIDNIMQDPSTDEAKKEAEDEKYNPLRAMNDGSVTKILNGQSDFAQKNAIKVFRNLDLQKFQTYFDEQFDKIAVDAGDKLIEKLRPYAPDISVDNAGEKCAAVFAKLIEQTAEGTLEQNQGGINFERTHKDAGFDKTFIKVDVCQVSNGFDIEFRRLSVASQTFDYTAIKDYLKKNLGLYVFSRLEIEKMVEKEQDHMITQQAIELMTRKGNFAQLGDEVGNMILYVLLERILDAPKVFYQIEVAAGTLTNNGGLHLLRAKTPDGSHQIIFGESKLVGDLTSAVDAAFEVVASSKDKDTQMLPLLEPTIMNIVGNKATRDYLKSILIPVERDEKTEVNNAYGIFLGYNLGVDAGADFVKRAEQKMNADIKACIPHIKRKIEELKLSHLSFYFYIIPFTNVDNDKDEIIRAVCGGGADAR